MTGFYSESGYYIGKYYINENKDELSERQLSEILENIIPILGISTQQEAQQDIDRKDNSKLSISKIANRLAGLENRLRQKRPGKPEYEDVRDRIKEDGLRIMRYLTRDAFFYL